MNRIDLINRKVASTQTDCEINEGLILKLIRQAQSIYSDCLARVSVTCHGESFSPRTLDGRNSTLRERSRTPRACAWKWKTRQMHVYSLRFGLDTEKSCATSSSSLFPRGSVPGCSRTDN